MDDHSNTDVDLVDDEFERLGRLAGAELRQPPPADGPETVLRTAHRRRATVAVVAAGVTVAVVVTGLFVATSRTHDEPAPIATVPTPAPVVPTTAPADPENAAPPDAERRTTPGTWRAVADPSSLAPEFPAAAVWTGTDVIVIGSHVINNSELAPPSAAAYDVGQDQWRALAEPPPAFSTESPGTGVPVMQWTGSEVLAATSQGEVYAYDPVQDLWEARARPDESMSLPSPGALVAVSARGALARSSTGWWWYEHTTDQWESVPAPPGGDGHSTLAALDQDRIVAASIDDATITSAVFDIASRTWRSGPPVEDAPVSDRDDSTTCDANEGLLVCWAEGVGKLDGVVIDPLVGRLDRFALGSHSNSLTTKGLPWMTHAWKLLAPRTATWEDLPPTPDGGVDSFSAAVWTGSEIVFLGGSHSATGEPLGATAAYTPLRRPDSDGGT